MHICKRILYLNANDFRFISICMMQKKCRINRVGTNFRIITLKKYNWIEWEQHNSTRMPQLYRQLLLEMLHCLPIPPLQNDLLSVQCDKCFSFGWKGSGSHCEIITVIGIEVAIQSNTLGTPWHWRSERKRNNGHRCCDLVLWFSHEICTKASLLQCYIAATELVPS